MRDSTKTLALSYCSTLVAFVQLFRERVADARLWACGSLALILLSLWAFWREENQDVP